MIGTKHRWALWVVVALLAAPVCGTEFALRVEGTVESPPSDGRALLLLSTDEAAEPRSQIRPSVDSMQVFGVDFEDLAPGESVVIDETAVGWPVRRWADLPPGEYWVQGLINRYERFDLASGHRILLPPDRGEGQHWNSKPGNPYSTPRRLRVEPVADGRIEIVLDRVIEPIDPPADTRYVRHVRMKSELLSEFWGRDVYLGAHVLVPEGFDEHPQARYPLMIFHGHFPDDFGGFRTEPPDPDLPCEYSARFGVDCYNRIQQEEAYAFYQQWIAADFPRYLVIEIQHANPYYDDSYAVNSENLGPYGDAITHELVPFIERQFRGLGEPWARFLYGGSTGGWEALAAQVLYPDDYNGCFAACPDPIDFRAYMTVNIYEDANAYRWSGPFGDVERPGHRNWLGHVNATIEDFNHYELALGTKNRSGDQFDIWEAVYSPQGEDGHPRRLWDKESGEIDPEVAAFWRENFDLGHILRRDWESLGPKLAGKIHLYCGDMDNYYLNNAVYLVEEFLAATTDPPYAGEVDYGDRAEHCWNGDHEHGNHISRLRYNTMYLPKILRRIEESAPPGADLTSWRY